MLPIHRRIRSRIFVVVKDPLAIGQMFADCGITEFDGISGEYIRSKVPDGADPDAVLKALREHPNVVLAFFGATGVASAAYNAQINDTWTATDHPPGLKKPLLFTNTAIHYALDENNIGYLLTWHHGRINTYHAWKYGRGDPGVKIVVNDSGLRPGTPDMPILARENQYSENTSLWDAQDPFEPTPDNYGMGHGTMCAGIIFAQHNGVGVSGIAPLCTPAMTECSDIVLKDLELGALFLGFRDSVYLFGGNIISNSWGFWEGDYNGPYPQTPNDEPVSPESKSAVGMVNYAIGHGALVVCAAGNEGWSNDLYTQFPGEAPGVISVGALAPWNQKIEYSCWGSKVDIVAPTNVGTMVVLPSTAGQYEEITQSGYYWSGTGTSSSTPLVAGVAGLVWSQSPPVWPDGLWYPYRTVDNQVSGFTAVEVRDLLLSTVSPFLDPTGMCESTYFAGVGRYGYPRGVVNAAKAVMKARTKARGGVLPYVGFITQNWTQDDPAPTTVDRAHPPDPKYAGIQTVWHRKDAEGNVITQLGRADGTAGDVWVEVTGYVDGVEATEVELWLGNTCRYRGPPAVLPTTASSAGEHQAISVVAKTGSKYKLDRFDDIAVSTIGLSVVPGATLTFNDPVITGKNASLSGLCSEGSTVTVTINSVPYTASVVGSEWSYSTEVSGGVTEVAVSDGTDALTAQVTVTGISCNQLQNSLSGDKVGGVINITSVTCPNADVSFTQTSTTWAADLTWNIAGNSQVTVEYTLDGTTTSQVFDVTGPRITIAAPQNLGNGRWKLSGTRV